MGMGCGGFSDCNKKPVGWARFTSPTMLIMSLNSNRYADRCWAGNASPTYAVLSRVSAMQIAIPRTSQAQNAPRPAPVLVLDVFNGAYFIWKYIRRENPDIIHARVL